MAMRFDPTSKTLVERHPVDWLDYCGLHPHGPVSVIDSDVSTLTAISHRVIRVDESTPWLANFKLQSSYDPQVPERSHFYSAALSRRHGLPVRSIIVLLRKEAEGALLEKWVRPLMGSVSCYWTG